MVNDAVQALADLVDHLRDRGVRSFKGHLLNPDGSKLWELDMVFEKPPQPKQSEDANA